jgi:hypothetical protein
LDKISFNMQSSIRPTVFYARLSRMNTEMGYMDSEKTVQASFRELPVNVMRHIIKHDIALTLDIISLFRQYWKINPLLRLNY